MDIDRRDAMRAFLAAGGLAALDLARPKGASAQQVPEFLQGFRRVEGEVFVNGQPAEEGTLVNDGDVVTTGPASLGVLVSGEDAFLIRENAEAQFPGESVGVRFFTVVAGMMLSVFGPGQRRMNTPFATAGIRGSAAFTDARPDLTYFCLCYGQADIQSNRVATARDTITTTHHESPRFIHSGDSGPVIEPAPVINHTDEELIFLESLVGRIPDFGPEPLPYE